MNQIESQVDRIIRAVKKLDGIRGVRFVKEYNRVNLETPVNSWIASVSITDTSVSKSYIGGYLSSSVRGDMYCAGVEIRLFAPVDENGAGLSELACELVEGLKKVDEEKIITEINASSIEFDPDLNAIYRRVNFTIDFCLCEEA